MEKKIVLITGGRRGIGKACAIAFSREGYSVALHYRSNDEEAKTVQKEIGDCELFKEDLTSEEACQRLVKNVAGKYGRIDALINNAGKTVDQLLPFAKVSDFDDIINTNVRPVFLLTKFISKQMIRQKSGSIINISSLVGFTGNKGQALYSASKSAIIGFTKASALEFAGFGIRVNCVAPGFIDTAMTQVLSPEIKEAGANQIPLKRFGTPEEVAQGVLFLASDKASYITGTTLHVNGGLYMG